MNTRKIIAFICMATFMATHTLPAHAQDDLPHIVVRQPGDTLKTCDELWNEALSMREVIAQTRISQNDNKMTDRGIGAAGAIAGMLIGTATGGIGIAAAGLAARAATEARTEEAEKIQEAAQQRRALMAGIFMVKDCPGPIENALSDIKVMSVEEQALSAIAPAGGAPVGPLPEERTAGTQVMINGETGGDLLTGSDASSPYPANYPDGTPRRVRPLPYDAALKPGELPSDKPALND